MKTIFDIIEFSKEEVKKVVDNIESYYLSFPIKKSNGSFRWIDAPQEPLKTMQKNILKNLVYQYKPHPCAYGFVKNRSVKDGAKRHLQSKTLLCMDITNFFKSIHTKKVYGICTYLLNNTKDKIIYDNEEELDYLVKLLTYKNSLPQGSPASPGLANMYCLTLDKNLNNLAKKYNLSYTRYADDISFSHPDKGFLMYKIMPEIYKLLENYNLVANEKKTRVLRPHKRMVVTGIVVNEKLGTPKWVWRNLRAKLHNLNKTKQIISQEEYTKIRGQIEWIKTLHKVRGELLLQELGKVTLQN